MLAFVLVSHLIFSPGAVCGAEPVNLPRSPISTSIDNAAAGYVGAIHKNPAAVFTNKLDIQVVRIDYQGETLDQKVLKDFVLFHQNDEILNVPCFVRQTSK